MIFLFIIILSFSIQFTQLHSHLIPQMLHLTPLNQLTNLIQSIIISYTIPHDLIKLFTIHNLNLNIPFTYNTTIYNLTPSSINNIFTSFPHVILKGLYISHTSQNSQLTIPLHNLSKIGFTNFTWNRHAQRYINTLLPSRSSVKSCHIYNYSYTFPNKFPFSSFPNARTIKLYWSNCTIDMLNHLSSCPNLTSLTLEYVDDLPNIQSLTDHPNLKRLTLICAHHMVNLKPLAHTRISHLVLKRLHPRTKQIINLTPLLNVPTLQSLKIINFDAILSQLNPKIKIKMRGCGEELFLF